MQLNSPEVICDWTTGVHRFPEPVPPIESGKVLKVDRDGVIEWEKADWETIRCPSSDTSLRFSCDGRKLRFMGNIGRFRQQDNLLGLSIVDAVSRWPDVLAPFGLDLRFFGSVVHQGTVFEYGTVLTRIDLAANYDVDDFKSWCAVSMQQRIGRRLPLMGRYGPQWGYEAKRGNWWKAKIYDKAAELAGERGPRSGSTIARFEVQLGSEYLKREGLQYLMAWNRFIEGKTMAQVIYGRFASELFREQATVETWADIPPRLRQYAILWRDGVDVRAMVPRSTWFRIVSHLRDYGVDISVPCNVVALTRRVRDVSVKALPALRRAA